MSVGSMNPKALIYESSDLQHTGREPHYGVSTWDTFYVDIIDTLSWPTMCILWFWYTLEQVNHAILV